MKLSLLLVLISVSFPLLGCTAPATTPTTLVGQPEISPDTRRLFQKADALYQKGEFVAAARTAELALESSHDELPVNIVDTVRLEIANMYEKGGLPTDAIRTLRSVLQHTPGSPQERLVHGQVSYQLAKLLYQNGELEEAHRHVTEVENLAKQLDHPSALFDALVLTSVIEKNLGRDTEVIRALTEALAVLPRLDPPRPAARLLILNQLAWEYSNLNRYPEAETTTSEYLKEARQQGDLGHQAKALYLRGNLKYRQGEMTDAVDAFFSAARKASERPDRVEAMGYFKLGLTILERLKKYSEMKDALLVALDRYDQVFEDANDKAFLLSMLGQTWIQLGVYDAGNVNLFRAYQLYRDAGNDHEAAQTMIYLAQLMNTLRNSKFAYAYFTIALNHASKAKAEDLMAIAHKSLGVLYQGVGWYVDAFREYQDARRIYGSLGRTDLIYSVEFLILELYRSMGDSDKLREQLGRLEKYATQDPSLRGDYLYWVNLAITYSALGAKERAREHASNALIAARRAKDTQGELLALEVLANYGSAQESISLLQQAYSLAQQNRVVGQYGLIQSHLGWAFLNEGVYEAAIEAFNNSIAATEMAVKRAPFAETRVSFAAESLSPYDGLILTLYQLYKRGENRELAEKALLVHEKSRAREFATTLAVRRVKEIAKTLPENVYAEEEALAKEIDALEREVYKLAYSYERSEALLEQKQAELHSKRERYSKLMSTIQARHPQYAITKRRDLVGVSSLPARPDEVLLVYRDVVSGIFVWAITPSQSGAEIQSFDFIGDHTALRAAMLNTLGGFMKDDPESPSRRILGFMSDKLLRPVLSTAASASHLTIIRDGVLEFLPFEMLPVPDDSGLIVLDRWTVGYYPSLLSMVANRSPIYSDKEVGKKVLLVGDAKYGLIRSSEAEGYQGEKKVKLRSGTDLGELPFSAVEIEEINKLFESRQIPTTVLKGSIASEGHIKQLDLREYKYLHFAVHGLLANEVFGVGEPSLALTTSDNRDDSFLMASEVMDLNLNAELVVLSACRTALGEYHPGEGIANLARSFISAGAHSVIVSQWAVADQSTAQLMIELYENLDRGLPLPQALRAAKKVLRKRYPSPYYWAPFILIGG